MSIDVVENRIATLQSQLAALAAGQTPSVGAASADAASTLAFSDVLDAQNGDLSSLLDQVGGGVSTSGSSTRIELLPSASSMGHHMKPLAQSPLRFNVPRPAAAM